MDEPHDQTGHAKITPRLSMAGVLKLALFLNYPVLWGAYFWVKAHPGAWPLPDMIGLAAHDTPERYGGTPMAVDCVWPVPLLNLQFTLYWVWAALMGLAAWQTRHDPAPDIPVPTAALAAFTLLSPALGWLVWKMFFLPDCWNYMLFSACRGPIYLVIGPPVLFTQLAMTWGIYTCTRELWARLAK